MIKLLFFETLWMLLLQGVLLVVIRVIVTCIMCWNSPSLNKSKISLNNIFCKRKLFGYCFYLFSVISSGLAQSDHIKRHPIEILLLPLNLLSYVLIHIFLVGLPGFARDFYCELSFFVSLSLCFFRRSVSLSLSLCLSACLSFPLQCAPLNGITLGQRETDSNNRLILISESTKHTLGRKWSFGICQTKWIWFHKPIDPIIRDPIKRRPLYISIYLSTDTKFSSAEGVTNFFIRHQLVYV